MTPMTLHITGMSCGHCLKAVTNALSSAAGVQLRSVQMGRAELDYDSAVTTPAEVADIVADAGYAATPAPAGA
jgi:copper chaperone